MWDIFFSLFIVAALAFMFARAWNMVAVTFLEKYEIKDSNGKIVKPLLQIFIYALTITIISVAVLYIAHRYSCIDLYACKKKNCP